MGGQSIRLCGVAIEPTHLEIFRVVFGGIRVLDPQEGVFSLSSRRGRDIRTAKLIHSLSGF